MNGSFLYGFGNVTFALSPEGTDLAFIAADDTSVRRIWIRRVTTLESKPIAGTEGAESVFWSPDGHSIGFFASGTLKRLDLPRGTPVSCVPSLPTKIFPAHGALADTSCSHRW